MTRRYPRGERLVDERDVGRRGRGEAYSQRKTLTLHQYHALCTFPALGGSDVRAPFFADAKVPSMNAVSHAAAPAHRAPPGTRQTRSQVPSSSQRFSRRQHVAGLGYSLGRSRHRAPVFSTHKMPSMTARLPTQGRPPRRLRASRGRCGSILAHCASVTRTPRLAMSATSGRCGTAAREKVQVLINCLRQEVMKPVLGHPPIELPKPAKRTAASRSSRICRGGSLRGRAWTTFVVARMCTSAPTKPAPCGRPTQTVERLSHRPSERSASHRRRHRRASLPTRRRGFERDAHLRCRLIEIGRL